MLTSIYANSSHAYCYECWAMGHIPTRARTCRIEPGRVWVARAHDLRIRMQFDSEVIEPENFLFLFYPIYFKNSV